MPLVFGVLVDVFLRKTAEKDAVETRVESVQVGATHVTDTRLGLGKKRGGGDWGRSERGEIGQFSEKMISRTEPSDIMDSVRRSENGAPCRLIPIVRSVRHSAQTQPDTRTG